jgi:hypothetical protein
MRGYDERSKDYVVDLFSSQTRLAHLSKVPVNAKRLPALFFISNGKIGIMTKKRFCIVVSFFLSDETQKK